MRWKYMEGERSLLTSPRPCRRKKEESESCFGMLREGGREGGREEGKGRRGEVRMQCIKWFVELCSMDSWHRCGFMKPPQCGLWVVCLWCKMTSRLASIIHIHMHSFSFRHAENEKGRETINRRDEMGTTYVQGII